MAYREPSHSHPPHKAAQKTYITAIIHIPMHQMHLHIHQPQMKLKTSLPKNSNTADELRSSGSGSRKSGSRKDAAV